MHLFNKIIFAASAALVVVNGIMAIPLAHQHGHHAKRDVTYVTLTQEIVEVVAEISTVWVDAPADTPTPTPTPTAVAVDAPLTSAVGAVIITPTTTLEAATPTATEEVVAATSSASSGPNDDTSTTGSDHSGDATFYAPGMGSCGIDSTDTDMIVAMAASTMALTSTGNPNTNPMCGKKIKVWTDSNPTGVIVTIVDTCPGCTGADDIDLSPSAFDIIGSEAAGKIPVTWAYV